MQLGCTGVIQVWHKHDSSTVTVYVLYPTAAAAPLETPHRQQDKVTRSIPSLLPTCGKLQLVGSDHGPGGELLPQLHHVERAEGIHYAGMSRKQWMRPGNVQGHGLSKGIR